MLSNADRFASQKFRRFARYFHAWELDWSDAMELVAFLAVVGVDGAGYIFGWHAYGRHQARRLLDYSELCDDAQGYVFENLEKLTKEDGLAIFIRMREGRWKHGRVPDIVMRSMQEYHHLGMSWAKVARLFGLSRDKLRYIRRVHAGSSRVSDVENVGLGPLWAS